MGIYIGASWYLDKFITEHHWALYSGVGMVEGWIHRWRFIYPPVDELAQVGNWEKAEFSAPEEDNSLRNLGSKKIQFPIHLLSEVEENRELPATGQLGARFAQFIKESVRTRLVMFWFLSFLRQCHHDIKVCLTRKSNNAQILKWSQPAGE